MQESESKLSAEEQRNLEMQKIMELPREQKRARLRIRHGAHSRPFARVRSGRPTGQTAHFAKWMADLRAVTSLRRLKLDRLADDLTGDLAAAFAILRVNGGIKTIYDLTQCDVHHLLSVQQIGPKRLALVEKFLRERNVNPAWTVN